MCVCLCALLTGVRSGEMVGKGVMKVVLPHSYVIKAKLCLSSCPCCQLSFLDTINTFCILCSTRSFDRVVRYVLGKALKVGFPATLYKKNIRIIINYDFVLVQYLQLSQKFIKPATWYQWNQIGSGTGLLVPQGLVIKIICLKNKFQDWSSYILFGFNYLYVYEKYVSNYQK